MKKKYSDPLMFSHVMLGDVISEPSQEGGPLFGASKNSKKKLGVNNGVSESVLPSITEEGTEAVQEEIIAPESAESVDGPVVSEEKIENVLEQIAGPAENPEAATDMP